MAKTSTLRTVFAPRFLGHLDNALVFKALCNSDYEGDASTARTVTINQLGDVVIGSYVDTSAMTIQPVTSSGQNLTLSNMDYFNFKVEDIDTFQSNMNFVDEMAQRAAYAQANKIDAYIETSVFKGYVTSGSCGTSGSALIASSSYAFDTIVDLGVQLDKNNVPRIGRWCVIPPDMLGHMVKDDRFVTSNPVIQQNGLVQGAQIAGHQVFISNNLTSYGTGASKEYHIYAGHPVAATFAVGLREVEPYRPEGYFAQAVKGLTVYAGKVTIPAGIYQGVVKFA